MTPVASTLGKVSYSEVLHKILTTELRHPPALSISPVAVGLPSSGREGVREERERRTLSLSCKPEWNTLLQSAKLAAEGWREAREREQSERREERKKGRKEGRGRTDLEGNENGNGKESCGCCSVYVYPVPRDRWRNIHLESRTRE